MKTAMVSVCVPNFNTRPFLQERVDTILAQTHTNWEMIVSDNYSNDGSWEFFQELAATDCRISISQAPREGMYANWNNCLKRARGEYVYIATSDDTMAANCLEKLVTALEEHQDCDIAHTMLRAIDESGRDHRGMNHWWENASVFGRTDKEFTNRPHVRRAPYDGLLHFLGETVYVSMTQLLIRRTLFDKAGMFSPQWGSVGDFAWGMRASLVANTVHVPDTWGGWRLHPSQATASAGAGSAEHARKIDEMIADSLLQCEPLLPPPIAAGLRNHWLDWSREMRTYYRNLGCRPKALPRRLFQVAQVFSGPKAARSEMFGRMCGRLRWPDRAAGEARRWLESLGFTPLVLLPPVGGPMRRNFSQMPA